MFEKELEGIFPQGEEVPRLWLHLQAADTDEQVLQANMKTPRLICHEIQALLTEYLKSTI